MSDMFGIGSIAGLAGGATSLAGGMLDGIFGKSEVKPIRYSGDLGREMDRFSRSMSADDPTYAGALADYATANKARIANTQRMAGLAEADFGNLLGTVRNYDPVVTHDRLLGSQVGALKDVMGFAKDAGRREDSLRMAALGLGGRPGGAYEQALVADRTARAFAPQFGNIISNLNGVYSTAEGSRSSNLADAIGLINARTGTADYGAGLELNPALATLNIRGGQIANYGGLADAIKANTAGFTEQKNWASKIGGAMQNAGNGIMGAAGGMGMMGGGGGGFLGLGGAGGLNLGGALNGLNFGLSYGGGGPSNFGSLTPAERMMYAGYMADARQNVPFGSKWE